MAHAPRDRLEAQLSALLTAMDAAVRKSFDDSRRRAHTPRHARRGRGGVLAALRRLFRVPPDR